MRKKIYGIPVATPFNPEKLASKVPTNDAPPIVCDAIGDAIALNDSVERPLHGLSIYGKTTQDGTPTPEAPLDFVSVGDSGAININVCGKNIVDVFNEKMNLGRSGSNYDYSGYEHREYLNKVNADGTINIDISGSKSYGLGFAKSLRKGQTVTISFDILSVGNGAGLRFRVYDTNDYSSPKKNITYTTMRKVSVTYEAEADSKYVFCWMVPSGTMPCGAQIKNLQLEFNYYATDYEPYTSSGSVSVITTNPLHGIPVSSDGNYTDADGQQWICDEVDFAKGVYIKRVQKVGMHQGSEIHGAYLSTTGELSEGATVLCALETPTVTALTTEDMNAFKSMHTNFPNTTVYNDVGAYMNLWYVVDTKKYTDGDALGKITNVTPNTVVTSGAVNAMLLLAEDYFKWAYNNNGSSPLIYGGAEEDNSLWYKDMAPTLADDGTEQYTINCSGFANILLQAVPFEGSRYHLGADADNQHQDWAYRYDDSARYGDLGEYGSFENSPAVGNNLGCVHTYDMLKYAQKHGFDYKVADDFSNVRPGDLLFRCKDEYPERYLGISHCAICLAVDKEREQITFVHSTTATRKIPGSTEELPVGIGFGNISVADKTYRYGARFPMGDISTAAELMTCATKSVDNVVQLDNVDRGIYTCVVKGNFSSNPRFTFGYVGDSKSDYLTMLKVDHNTYVLTRYLYGATTTLSIKPGSDSTVFDVESVALYHGYASPHGYDDRIALWERMARIEKALGN